jgi:hypothetical protein
MTMALTDTFVKQVKLVKPTGDKYTDGEGMYLLVLASGKYWRMDYRYLGKRKTMALGVYPATSLAKARLKRADVREKLADGIAPSLAKREERDAQTIAASQTFELIARQWLLKTVADRATTTQVKVTGWLEKDVFPYIGTMPISAIKPRDVLITVQKMETRGAVESADRVKQICGQVFRYAVASGLAERDVTADLRGALATAVTTNDAAITKPKKVGDLMRSIHGYSGHPYSVAALRVSPLVFQRPGEVRAMEWVELDLDEAEWRIPTRRFTRCGHTPRERAV